MICPLCRQDRACDGGYFVFAATWTVIADFLKEMSFFFPLFCPFWDDDAVTDSCYENCRCGLRSLPQRYERRDGQTNDDGDYLEAIRGQQGLSFSQTYRSSVIYSEQSPNSGRPMQETTRAGCCPCCFCRAVTISSTVASATLRWTFFLRYCRRE